MTKHSETKTAKTELTDFQKLMKEHFTNNVEIPNAAARAESGKAPRG